MENNNKYNLLIFLIMNNSKIIISLKNRIIEIKIKRNILVLKLSLIRYFILFCYTISYLITIISLIDIRGW
jgi:hypothetical protein